MHLPNSLEKEINSTVIADNFMRVSIVKMLLSLNPRVNVAKRMNTCIDYYQISLVTKIKILKELNNKKPIFPKIFSLNLSSADQKQLSIKFWVTLEKKSVV